MHICASKKTYINSFILQVNNNNKITVKNIFFKDKYEKNRITSTTE